MVKNAVVLRSAIMTAAINDPTDETYLEFEINCRTVSLVCTISTNTPALFLDAMNQALMCGYRPLASQPPMDKHQGKIDIQLSATNILEAIDIIRTHFGRRFRLEPTQFWYEDAIPGTRNFECIVTDTDPDHRNLLIQVTYEFFFSVCMVKLSEASWVPSRAQAKRSM